MLERLLGLVEQAHVLDGNNCLVGESLDQVDLLLRERPHLLAINGQRANHHVCLQQRQPHSSAGSKKSDRAQTQGVALSIRVIIGDVRDLYCLPDSEDATKTRLRSGTNLPGEEFASRLIAQPLRGDALEFVAFTAEHDPPVRRTQTRGIAQDHLEDRRHIRRRARDNAQDLADGGLLVEGFLALVEESRVFDRNHRLICEGRKERDLLLRERLGFEASARDHAEHLAFAQQRHRDYRAALPGY